MAAGDDHAATAIDTDTSEGLGVGGISGEQDRSSATEIGSGRPWFVSLHNGNGLSAIE